MRRGRNKSIKVQLAAFFLVLIAASMLCQVIFNLGISKSVFLNEKQKQIEQLFYSLEANYTDDEEKIWEIVTEAQNVQNIRVLIASDREVIYQNPPFERGPEREVRTEEPTLTVFSAPWNDEEKMIVMTGTIRYRGEPRYVTLTTSVQAIDDSVALFTKTNIIISLGVMALGGAGVLIFAGKLSRPIRNIEAVAQEVSELNFGTKADEQVSAAELCSLARSINTMADRLEGMIGDLSSANEKLKDKVDYQQQAEQMRREFIANVSHEMKTPLSMLMMYSESLRSDIPGIDRNYYLDTIMEEADRLNDMVMQLLDISALENGLSRIEPVPFDFSAFADSVTEKAAVLLSEQCVSRSIEGGIRVLGDQKYLERAIRNYIVNARAHTAEGGQVRILLERRGGQAYFSVFNQGEPVGEKDLERIWDSFYRADQARTQTESHRVGLGLYIVKTIIRSHGGSYGARNTADGVEFWFSLNAESDG
ncbi:sensor histidine kinase [Bacilliculturomica massiliensis]|uniref:sensor histidine kinase n=1 Tax=Bacilliculturomica massiliensis TaxID=1917867 RepID=UPI00102FD361|nr:histidine kinase dimerization/phospho-acceptor domain-containing protein [Bacilliculturomica massiliensis]